ncbi:MAG: alpha/beta fold hydrolase [Thermodesulfobacteriota bacterium]
MRESGAGRGAVVCLHDFLDGADVWDALAAGLSADGRVIALQQRGHGDSTAPPGECELRDLGADLLAVLDAVGVDRAVLVGQGLGATVALACALAAPERVAGLCLIAPLVALDERAARDWAQVVRAGEVNKLQGLARSVWGPMSRRNADGDGIALTAIARAVHRLHAQPLAPRLGEIRCPTLVVASGADPAAVERARDAAGRIAGARLEVPPQPVGAAPAGGDVHGAALLALLREHLTLAQ